MLKQRSFSVSKPFAFAPIAVNAMSTWLFPPQKTRLRKMIRRSVLFLLLSPLLFISVQSASAALPAITVTPSAVTTEAKVTVNGSGFAANATNIAVWLDTNSNGNVDSGEPIVSELKSDGVGNFTTHLPLSGVSAGAYSIQAGYCSGDPIADPISLKYCIGSTTGIGTTGVASTPVTIMLGASPSHFGSGQHVTVTGYGFSPGTSVNVWFDKNHNSILDQDDPQVSVPTDQAGAFTTSLVVSGDPGDYFIDAGPSTAAIASSPVHIDSCWFNDECFINGLNVLCLIGNSPDTNIAGINIADCKTVDSDYTNRPGGYDLTNKGATFPGAGLLAAATADLGPVPGPGSGCPAITAAIALAEGYGNSVPDKFHLDFNPFTAFSSATTGLVNIACGTPPTITPISATPPFPPLDLPLYIVAVGGNAPDGPFLLGLVGAIQLAAATAAAVPGAPPGTREIILTAAQEVFAQAAVAADIACGKVDSHCEGSEIIANIMGNPGLQTKAVPISLLQPPLKPLPDPNPCPSQNLCWGDIVGWATVACRDLTPVPEGVLGPCENGNYPQDRVAGSPAPHLPIPGSAGSNNSAGPIMCATGSVLGLSIGFDGDVSFDVNDSADPHVPGPNVAPLVNYHNFQPGPGGSDAPDGIDIEIPLADRDNFHDKITQIRKGTGVTVCGHWVADMHQLWNELHPITSLSILAPATMGICELQQNVELPACIPTCHQLDVDNPGCFLDGQHLLCQTQRIVATALDGGGSPIPGIDVTFETVGGIHKVHTAKTDNRGLAYWDVSLAGSTPYDMLVRASFVDQWGVLRSSDVYVRWTPNDACSQQLTGRIDINRDGVIDAFDALSLLQAVAGLVSTCQICIPVGSQYQGMIFGDLNCDGIVNAIDVVDVLRVLVGEPGPPTDPLACVAPPTGTPTVSSTPTATPTPTPTPTLTSSPTVIPTGTLTPTATPTPTPGPTLTASPTPVNQPPTAFIDAPANNTEYMFTDGSDLNGYYKNVTLTGHATDPEQGTLSGSALVWTDSVNGGAPVTLGTGGSLPVKLYTQLNQFYTHAITLTATDDHGAASTATITVTVDGPIP
jgi:hypothetical protein